MSPGGFASLPLRSINALVRPAGALTRPVAAALRPATLPRLLVQAVDDVHSIAVSTRELTIAVEQLALIESRVDSLASEVARMRSAVEAIGADVVAVRETTQPLGRFAARLQRRRRPPL